MEIFFNAPAHQACRQSVRREGVYGTLRYTNQYHRKRCSCIFQRQKHGRIQSHGLPGRRRKVLSLGRVRGILLYGPRPLPDEHAGLVGGAHPFALLDYSTVHNGEISSYDANRRTIEMYGYKCTLQTDTEVITYIIDYLHRKKGLTLKEICSVIAAPFWSDIERKPQEDREELEYLRNAFSLLLITGPFSIIVGFEGGLMALNDRLKLRSMVVAEKGDTVYVASEEAAIRVIENNPDKIWHPKGGEGVIITLEKGNP